MMNKYTCFVKIKYRAGQVSHLSLSLGGGAQAQYCSTDSVLAVWWSGVCVSFSGEQLIPDDLSFVTGDTTERWSSAEFQKNLPVSSATECALYMSVHLLHVQNRTVCVCALTVCSEQDCMCLCVTVCSEQDCVCLCATVCSEQDCVCLCTYCMFRTGLYVSVHLLYVQNRTVCVCVLLYVLSEKLLLGLDFSLPCILKCITFRYKTRCIHCMCVHN